MKRIKSASLMLLSVCFMTSCKTIQPVATSNGEEDVQLLAALTPDQALNRLKEGNQRYMGHANSFPDRSVAHREELYTGQHPFVTIVSCSDSRVPVEIVFDQGLGDLFVIRTAGNSLDDAMTMGSLEYGVEHTHTPLIVVMGHENCGGITAAIAPENSSEEPEDKELSEMVASLKKGVLPYLGKSEKLNEAVRSNVIYQIELIKKGEKIKNLIDLGKVKIVGAYYNLKTGKVDFMQE